MILVNNVINTQQQKQKNYQAAKIQFDVVYWKTPHIMLTLDFISQ